MKNSTPLHWSFDYNHAAQKPDFAEELLTLLQEYEVNSVRTCEDVIDSSIGHVYHILPNFWRGYIGRSKPAKSLGIGTVIIEREKDIENIWRYNVRYKNSTSGEDLQMQFGCSDENFRCLSGGWRVTGLNSCQDSYSAVEWNGSINKDSELKLNINNTQILIGKVNDSIPLTCNWTLFDVIPALADSLKQNANTVDISILDDLEQLRPKCKIGFLDSTESPIPLEGYFLYGTGVLPSYWWIDENGNIAVVSSVFETLVLRQYVRSSS